MTAGTGNTNEFVIEFTKEFKDNLIAFAGDFDTFCLLSSNRFYDGRDTESKPYYHDFDFIGAFGAKKVMKAENKTGFFDSLDEFHSVINDHLFGYLGYDLKNGIENLESENPDFTDMPGAYFFQPEIIVWLRGNKLIIQSNTGEKPEDVFNKLLSFSPSPWERGAGGEVILQSRFTRDEYLETVEKLRQHLIEGDVYEISFCQEFFAENVEIEPFSLFKRLMEISPNPFSAFLKIEGKYILSSSMERFLKKKGDKLISQPIKGTIRKSRDKEEDLSLQNQLLNDEKERAENVMIVDLVRNDLAKSSIPGSVEVEELFGIYPFSQVHQMISTVTSSKRDEVPWTQAIRNAFPMGSMTGAPKVRAMQLLEQYERSKRGVFSGAIGYITHDGDFDFNVVIRTLIYNTANKYLSLHVGSAITYDSVPEREFEECMVKIEGIKRALNPDSSD